MNHIQQSLESAMKSLYQIGRSKKNTVKIVVQELADGSKAYILTLTENGGQYNTVWSSVEKVIGELAHMWGIAVFDAIPYTNLRAKVLAKVKIISGEDILQNS